MTIMGPTNFPATGCRVSCVKKIQRHDVLLGRSRTSHNHEGNKYFRELVRERSLAYKTSTTRENKRRVVEEIIHLIQKCGGRFLSCDNCQAPFEISPKACHEKVSHALRSARITKKGEGKNQARFLLKQQSILSMGSSEGDDSYLNFGPLDSAAIKEEETKTFDTAAVVPEKPFPISAKETSWGSADSGSVLSIVRRSSFLCGSIEPLPLSTKETSWGSCESILSTVRRASFLTNQNTKSTLDEPTRIVGLDTLLDQDVLHALKEI